MCGIAGVYGARVDYNNHLSRMLKALGRRGPDGHGIWCDVEANIGFVHTRLSIIDLSDAASQPMASGDKRYWITFNGEVYNYKELRHELESNGFAFTTNSDTEVILAGWSFWGKGILSRMRGMFAFAIWDSVERVLVLCRDRIGVKPLLWAETGRGIVFGSTLKALTESNLIEPVIEPQGVFDILATGSVCQPRTIIRGVQSLTPGTIMSIGPDFLRKSESYWELVNAVDKLRPALAGMSYTDAVDLVRNLLDEACRYHLVADVPVGSFLSGGVDSTAITALMSRQMSSPVKSFSIGFDESSGIRNELTDAKIAAEYIGCEHTEVVVTGREVALLFDDFVNVVDQPSYDGLNTYMVSKAASKFVKVSISGLGGDELFAGYPHFQLLNRVSSSSMNCIERLASLIHWLRPNKITAASARLSSLRSLTTQQRYANLRRDMTDIKIASALRNELAEYFSPGFLEDYIETIVDTASESVAQTSIVECKHYLINTLLRDADAVSMGHGLEIRPMLLDHILVEHAIAFPSNFKLRHGRQKAVFKDAVQDLLPTSLLERPKTGFVLPLGWWLCNELQPRLEIVLNGKTANFIFKQEFLKQCKLNSTNPSYYRTLWTILILVSWIDSHGINVI